LSGFSNPNDRRNARQNSPNCCERCEKNTGNGRAIGLTKGGLNSKLHLVCDGAEKPVRITVSGGNEADISHAKQCLEPIIKKGSTVIADRGYDADHLRDWLRKSKVSVCIPPRKNRKTQYRYSKKLYKTRNLVERCFNRIKDWRSLSLRTFRCPETFLAAAHLAAIVIWYL